MCQREHQYIIYYKQKDNVYAYKHASMQIYLLWHIETFHMLTQDNHTELICFLQELPLYICKLFLLMWVWVIWIYGLISHPLKPTLFTLRLFISVILSISEISWIISFPSLGLICFMGAILRILCNSLFPTSALVMYGYLVLSYKVTCVFFNFKKQMCCHINNFCNFVHKFFSLISDILFHD